MMKQIKIIHILDKISEMQLMNASYLSNLGLLHGKLGISIFLYELDRLLKRPAYLDFAGELIDQIYSEISPGISSDFEDGLAGIGWGIEYLHQRGFLEMDTDEVLFDIDNRVMNTAIHDTPDHLSIYKGMLGYGYYLMMRITNRNSKKQNVGLLEIRKILIHLIDEIEVQVEKNKANLVHFGKFRFDDCYVQLIIFLVLIHKQHIYNYKVEKILANLIELKISTSNSVNSHFQRSALGIATHLLSQHHSLSPNTAKSVNSGPPKDFDYMDINDLSIRGGLAGMILQHNIHVDLLHTTFAPISFDGIYQVIMRKLLDGQFDLENEALGFLDGVTGVGFCILRNLKS